MKDRHLIASPLTFVPGHGAGIMLRAPNGPGFIQLDIVGQGTRLAREDERALAEEIRDYLVAAINGGQNMDMHQALRDFAKANGRNWKAKLRELWASGGDDDQPLLRQARNRLGPRGLEHYQISEA